MGQAWCKEKTSKAQDSKSPLDRVFVRCAHRIYPSLKEEGSVLGGATQRVTSSEIGYAGSPPREVLARGRSIDSVDRPFHPSDWVDVNLEVPSTPVLTNLTVDANLYPATGPASICVNSKDVAPVPPPRRRKRNKGRPLPPKPDEIIENPGNNSKHADHTEEPLYSSVKSPKTSGDEQDVEDEGRIVKSFREDTEGRRPMEIYEHKVNGTGRIIPSDVVSGKRISSFEKRKIPKTSETSEKQRRIEETEETEETEEYERFARNQPVKDSSTPNREERKKPKDLEKQTIETIETIETKESSRGPARPGRNVRPKNYSTVSLPNYDELDATRHPRKKANNDGEGGDKTRGRTARRPVRSSTGSLPAESFLSPFSEKTSVRLEDYIPRRGSNDNLSPYRVLEKLDRSENGGFVKYDPSKLEDWDLGDIDNCELNHHERLSFEGTPVINDGKYSCKGEDVVDFSSDERNHEKRFPAEREISGIGAVPLGKPEAFGRCGKTPSADSSVDSSVDRNSRNRYPDPPTLAESCKTLVDRDSSRSSSLSREPFYLDEAKHRAALDTIGGSRTNVAISEETDRSEQSRMIFARSLSKESLPREMLLEEQELDFFKEKQSKTKTPPPSPEPRIKPEILDNDHSTLLKVLKEETAEESNLSSMTPSLTELEAALSDMLEKEEPTEESVGPRDGSGGRVERTVEPIEPEIVPVEKNCGSISLPIETCEEATGDKTLVDEDSKEKTVSLSLERILEEEKPVAAKGRKVSFCAWEESSMTEIDLGDDPEFVRDSTMPLDPNAMDDFGPCVADSPPEKPTRLHRNPEDFVLRKTEKAVPTPPRRKNKHPFDSSRTELAQNGSVIADPYPNDRLI